MIAILHEARHRAAADKIALALQSAFKGLAVALLPSETVDGWPADESCDDAMIVLFDSEPLSAAGERLGRAQARPERFVLPVGVSSHRVPPTPFSHLKAIAFDAGQVERVVARVGAVLGLRLRCGDQTVFISYRALDGTALAAQLETFLRSHGYRVWRDDAQDQMDGQTMIPPGMEVQRVIEENLQRADMLLVLDTPRAAESGWMNLEIDLANGYLIPVLPVFFKRPDDRRLQCSRFRILETLQRACVIPVAGADAPQILSEEELDAILHEMESYLREIFERRLRVPYNVKKEFEAQQYQWTERDRFLYEAVRQRGGRLRTRVFSHCSIYDGIYDRGLTAFVRHVEAVSPPANYALYVYDGPLIPLTQLEEVERAARLDGSSHVILLHHQEVRAVLQSNFTSRA